MAGHVPLGCSHSKLLKAQMRVEQRNYDIRKQLLEFDDVANDQRQVVYQQRRDLLEAETISDVISAIREDVLDGSICEFIPPQSVEDDWDIHGLEQHLELEFGVALPLQKWLDEDDDLDENGLRDRIFDEMEKAYETKVAEINL